MRSEAEIREAFGLFMLGRLAMEPRKDDPELSQAFMTMATIADTLAYALGEPSSMEKGIAALKADISRITEDAIKTARRHNAN